MIQEKKSIELIEHYFFLNRFEQALTLLPEALEEEPENAYLWYLLGYSNYALDRYEDAEQQLIEALRLGAKEDVVFYDLGRLYMETERWQESEEMFLEALRVDPGSAETHAYYALLMQKTGDKKKAKLLLKQALELDPESPVALRLHYFIQGINESAKEQVLIVERYLNSADSEAAKSLQLGLNEIFRNNMKEAKEHFRQAYLLEPENENILKSLEELEIASHPLLAPNRIVSKLGGPVGIWFIGVGMGLLLLLTGVDWLFQFWAFFYIGYAIYTWISEPLVRMMQKVRG